MVGQTFARCIQYIGEPVGGYITCYATKEEKEETEEIWDAIQKAADLREKSESVKTLSFKLTILINLDQS